jgi:hypothetical protein
MTGKINSLISGFGGIGYRHLQGILKYKVNGTVYIYDINKNQYEEGLAKLQHDFNPNYIKERIKFINSYDDVKEDVFLLILSGPSEGRFDEFKKVQNSINIKFTIIEKLIENDVVKLDNLLNISKDKNIFVNTPRRLWPFYKNMKEIKVNSLERITIKAPNLNPISNAIHFFDLLFYLFDIFPIKISSHSSDIKFFETKRLGYLDVFGKISWEMSNGIIIDFISDPSLLGPVVINFKTNISEIRVLEDTSVFPNEILYQSTISELLVKSLHKTNLCDLPRLQEVGFFHKIYTENIVRFFRKNYDKNINKIPST